MICKKCGKENADSAKFCVACGQQLVNIEEDSSGNEISIDPSIDSNTTAVTEQNAAPAEAPAPATPQTGTPAPTPAQGAVPSSYPTPAPTPTPAYTQYPAPAPTQAPVYPQYPTPAPTQAPVYPQYPTSAPTQAPAYPQYPAPAPAPTPAYTQYPAPAPTQAGVYTAPVQPVTTYPVSNPVAPIASAAKTVSGGVKWTIALSVIAAIAVLLFALFYKTDEQKIEDRIESFNIACNSGDIQGMFDCFDKYTRQMYSTTIGLTEGIIGGLTGFDLPLGDLFNLFAMDSFGGEGLGLEIEIESIEVNDHTAIVTLTDACAENLGQDTIIMCKEEDDWFIDLRATEAAAPAPEDTETNDFVTENAAMR